MRTHTHTHTTLTTQQAAPRVVRREPPGGARRRAPQPPTAHRHSYRRLGTGKKSRRDTPLANSDARPPTYARRETSKTMHNTQKTGKCPKKQCIIRKNRENVPKNTIYNMQKRPNVPKNAENRPNCSGISGKCWAWWGGVGGGAGGNAGEG